MGITPPIGFSGASNRATLAAPTPLPGVFGRVYRLPSGQWVPQRFDDFDRWVYVGHPTLDNWGRLHTYPADDPETCPQCGLPLITRAAQASGYCAEHRTEVA